MAWVLFEYSIVDFVDFGTTRYPKWHPINKELRF